MYWNFCLTLYTKWPTVWQGCRGCAGQHQLSSHTGLQHCLASVADLRTWEGCWGSSHAYHFYRSQDSLTCLWVIIIIWTIQILCFYLAHSRCFSSSPVILLWNPKDTEKVLGKRDRDRLFSVPSESLWMLNRTKGTCFLYISHWSFVYFIFVMLLIRSP